MVGCLLPVGASPPHLVQCSAMLASHHSHRRMHAWCRCPVMNAREISPAQGAGGCGHQQ